MRRPEASNSENSSKKLPCSWDTKLSEIFPRNMSKSKLLLQLQKLKMIAGKKLAIVPILRAGLGMVSGILSLVPSAKVGHIGLYRDEVTLEPHEYYCKLPEDIANRLVIILDPMLATGGSGSAQLILLRTRAAKTSSLCQ